MSDPDRPRRPVSERKLAANRANARKATGPKTPQGKARSARNSLKHGQTASPLTLLATASDQERELFERRMQQLLEQYRPANATEHLLVERLAIAYLRTLRAYQAERGAMAHTYQFAAPSGIKSLPFPALELLQYDAAAERSIVRILRELRRLGLGSRRAARDETTGAATKPPASTPTDADPEIEEAL